MTRRAAVAAELLSASLVLTGAFACLPAVARDDARTQAQKTGQYKVKVATDRERVLGTCKFVRSIAADTDPLLAGRPTSLQLAEYFRVQAVLIGADTLLVDGRTAEAYICGAGPLNPDGSLQTVSNPSGPTPAPKPAPR